MNIINEYFNGTVKIIQTNKYIDNRGFFSISYNKELLKNLNINENFCQDNFSFSNNKNTIRGIHFQNPPFEQSKLISVISGGIFDIFVDLRKNSKTFGKFHTITLDRNDLILYIPKGFGHGLCTLSDKTLVHYKVSNKYDPLSEETIAWNDTDLDIPWPKFSNNALLSDKDKKGIKFKFFKSKF